ncbi:hypothetical protein [Streptomyces sp. BF23-19]|uniref:hypothetical protein n=1 Tax=unclassified Streptomyces TaxID=2593676 RepID=UPI0034E3A5E2
MSGQDPSPARQHVSANGGFAYAVIGGDIHVYVDGLPVYVLENWRPAPDPDPEWLRELPRRMLSARHEIVPFTGRAEELADLDAWRSSRRRLAVRWLQGPGGQGKSRLAAASAREAVADGWKVIRAFHGVRHGRADLSPGQVRPRARRSARSATSGPSRPVTSTPPASSPAPSRGCPSCSSTSPSGPPVLEAREPTFDRCDR